MKPGLRVVVYGNAIIAWFLAIYLFVLPAGFVIQALRDPGLSTGGIPRFAFRWHRSLSGRYESWARERVASGRAAQLDTYDISGTEWPVFGTVFYLWATESLQQAWEEDPSLAAEMPAQYARGAIEAAAALVADPNHAAWVRDHWGEDYLHRENLFYRMLLISGLTSYEKLSGNAAYRPLLQDQVESLAGEIDASPYGLLDDYPGECYPIDIIAAIAAIRRADAVLGTDHAPFADRALRAFEDSRLDPATGLPAYAADSRSGRGWGSARGVGSFMLIWVPELWPETSTQWYGRYQQYFWQEGPLVSGFREFPAAYPVPGWGLDVDAGPIMAGYGTAASAFGIGATRANGHLEQAYPLTAEALVASWPLADGTLLGPRLLSNFSDAPYVGESALLFNLTRRPVLDGVESSGGRLPWSVPLALSAYIVAGLAWIGLATRRLITWRRDLQQGRDRPPRAQAWLWLGLVAAAGIGLILHHEMIGGLLLLSAQFLPLSPMDPVVRKDEAR